MRVCPLVFTSAHVNDSELFADCDNGSGTGHHAAAVHVFLLIVTLVPFVTSKGQILMPARDHRMGSRPRARRTRDTRRCVCRILGAGTMNVASVPPDPVHALRTRSRIWKRCFRPQQNRHTWTRSNTPGALAPRRDGAGRMYVGARASGSRTEANVKRVEIYVFGRTFSFHADDNEAAALKGGHAQKNQRIRSHDGRWRRRRPGRQDHLALQLTF